MSSYREPAALQRAHTQRSLAPSEHAPTGARPGLLSLSERISGWVQNYFGSTDEAKYSSDAEEGQHERQEVGEGDVSSESGQEKGGNQLASTVSDDKDNTQDRQVVTPNKSDFSNMLDAMKNNNENMPATRSVETQSMGDSDGDRHVYFEEKGYMTALVFAYNSTSRDGCQGNPVNLGSCLRSTRSAGAWYTCLAVV